MHTCIYTASIRDIGLDRAGEDPESYVGGGGGGITIFFCSSNILDGSPLPLAYQRNTISMAFSWWADDGVIFQGADPDHLYPSEFAHVGYFCL